VRGNHVGRKHGLVLGVVGRVDKNDRANVVANVALAFKLLRILVVEREHRRNVEHDVVAVKLGEYRSFARLSICKQALNTHKKIFFSLVTLDIQSTTEFVPILESNLGSNDV